MKSRFLAALRACLTTLPILTLLLMAGSGCAWSIGDSKHQPATVQTQPTRGQELIDLQKARDQGAISETEYETMRRQIMEQ